MRGVTAFVFLGALSVQCRAIYLTNSSRVKIEKNPAIWAEDEGIWGPLLEEWTIQNKRGARVMMFHPVPNPYVIEEKVDNDVAEKESKISPGKIVTTGTNNVNKKPSPPREISETDLYLLGAIEKLVYRVDFMEKRLRRVEEMLYYVMAGNRVDKGKDFWVGGLNPGLLWIWSNSARPVKAPGSQNNTDNPSAAIKGDGRCLRLAYNPGLRTYSYQGSDCSIRHSHICELPERTSSNEIRRIGRSRKILSDEL